MSYDRFTLQGRVSQAVLIALATIAYGLSVRDAGTMRNIFAFERKHGEVTPLLASFWVSCAGGNYSETLCQWFTFRGGCVAPMDTFPKEWRELVSM